MSQNIIYSPWERTKGPWLCLMITSLLFSLLRLFSFVSAFLTSLIQLIFWLKFSTGKRMAEDMLGVGCGGQGQCRGVTKSQTQLSNFQLNKNSYWNGFFHPSESCSIVFHSLWPHGLYSPWNSPGQNIGVGSHSLLQGIFPTQGSNPGLPSCK